MKKDVYQVITDRIVALLESGTVPWRKPWKGGEHSPRNFVSRKAYRGINLFLLNAMGFPSPFWLTFKQAHAMGGSIRKGEQSSPVVFWKVFEEEENGETRKIPFLRYHSVFNVTQCQGIALPVLPESAGTFEPIERCEQIVAAMPRRPTIEYGGERACYSPSQDRVMMPEPRLFETPDMFYSLLFHELTHSTGHLSRLNRKEVTGPILFGSDPYSREELVAEMGAAFLCGHCEIENTTLEQSASYIQSWLGRLKDDRKLVVQAAAQAQKACDFILDIQPEAEGPRQYQPKEFKVVALRECPTPEQMQLCETPQHAADYWRMHITNTPHFDPERECLVVLFLNTRRRIKGHHFVSTGTLDCLLIHPREVFRTACVLSASAVLLMHSHPSGDPTPSEADIKATRELIRAGQLMKIDVVDHVIVGNGGCHCSLRSLGYFSV